MTKGETESELSQSLTLDQLVRTIGDLPVAPDVLARALQLTSDTESDIKELARVLSSDQSLSAKVLRLSNSPYYGRLRTVTTVSEALQVLGFDTVRTVTIAASTHIIYRDLAQGSLSRTLWRHSLCTAVGAGKLAESIKMGDKESAYVAGLLHDIGKLVIYARAPHLFEKIVQEVITSGRDFCQVEADLLEFDHSDIASLLLSSWNIPSQLVKAVHFHHRLAGPGSSPANRLAYTVSLANDISKRLGVCFPGQKSVMTSVTVGDGKAAWDESQLQSFAETVREAFETEATLF